MRVFISHSSKDKNRYCNEVARRLIESLGKDAIVYDTLTFEAGERSIDEINRTLAISDLYVILLSENAVESRWVKYELKEAHKRLNEQVLERIYPIIIDPSLKYTDDRIPAWLKNYNLKYIARPAKTAKLIIERAKSHRPSLRFKEEIFVGRNDLVNDFELRIDDFDKPTLNTFIISGLPNIGRKSLAHHCLVKGNIVPRYYDFPQISLNYQESLEDFIIKIGDLGFTNADFIPDLMTKTLSEKTAYAVSLVKEIASLSEIILIKDDGCIIDYRGTIAEWFKAILRADGLSSQMLFVIITKYKTNFESIRDNQSAFFLNVPELSQAERKGLLRRLSDANHLDLTRDNLEQISLYLTGYPAQVHYAIDIINDKGFPYLQRNYYLLTNYNEQEVSSLLEKHSGDEKVFSLLALISKYDAISFTMLYKILDSTPEYYETYELLYQESLFELEGVNGEYVRLNEVVQNYIARTSMKILPAHRIKLQQLFEEMFSADNSAWYNSNDFLIGIRENVKTGKLVDSKYLIPSVYLKSMSDLYENMKYEDVVKLARRALQNTTNTDEKIVYEIRYLLCSALAKLRKADCLSEIQQLDYDDRTFLSAFYYRQIGKNDRALSRLNELLGRRPEMSKAKREKVLVLKNLQQFEDATGLAKENYYYYADNPYHIQAFFECLINTYYKKPEDSTLEDLLWKLSKIQSEKAKSMYGRCYSLYLAYVEHDYSAAMDQINKTVIDFPKDKKYALTVKFDIAQLYHETKEMASVIEELKEEGSNNNTVVICKSKLMAIQGNPEGAVEYFMKNISFFTDSSKAAFCEKLKARKW